MTRILMPNSSASFLAWLLQPAVFGVQLQKGLMKLIASISMPWSSIIFTARALSSPPESSAKAFLFITLSTSRCLFQGTLQILDDIFRGLEPDGEPHQGVRDTATPPFG